MILKPVDAALEGRQLPSRCCAGPGMKEAPLGHLLGCPKGAFLWAWGQLGQLTGDLGGVLHG